MTTPRKVAIVGAREVGTECARRLTQRGDVDVVVVDPEPGMARARALDINRSAVLGGGAPRALGSDSYAASAGSQLCVIAQSHTAARGLEPGDAMEHCRELVETASREIARRSPDTVMIVIAEPHELGCHFALAASGFPRGRVIGIGAMQASARLRLAIAGELGFSVADVHVSVLGAAADGASRILGPASAFGTPLESLIAPSRLDELWREQIGPDARAERASEPLSAAGAAAEIAGGVLAGDGRVLPCAAFCRGEYGIDGAFVAVPCRLGAEGIEEIVELPLSDSDLAALRAAGEAVRAEAKRRRR